MGREVRFIYCPECASELKSGDPRFGPNVLLCPACGVKLHPDPKLACAGLLEQQGAILLVKRARPPQRSLWCLPGGFVDRGETLEDAARREVLEETGIEVSVPGLWGLYSYPQYPIVVAIYRVLPVHSREGRPVVRVNHENTEARWFGRNEIPWDSLAFPSARDALFAWAEKRVSPD